MVLARRLDLKSVYEHKWSAVGIHFLMVAVLLVFLVLGSVLFMLIEGAHELEQCDRSRNIRRNAASALIQAAANHTFGVVPTNRSEMERITDEYISLMFQLFHQSSSLCKSPAWTFSNALFFTRFQLPNTTLTTIGYGNQVPVTSLGRAVVVLYGLVGVPLALVTIGDISKFVATFILHVYVRIHRIFGGSQCAFTEFNAQSSSILLVISAIYPLTVGLLPLLWEAHWSVVETVYFSFISTFSIGYGDVMPSSPLTYTLTILTVVVGLVFNSVLVDLLGGYCIQQIHYAGQISSRARRRARAMMACAASMKPCTDQGAHRWLQLPYIDEQSTADDL